MPQICTVCSHAESFAINEALVVERRSKRTVAAQYGLSATAIQRHKEHIPELLVKASQSLEVFHADLLIEKLLGLEADAREALNANRGEDWRVFLSAISEIRENIKLLAQVSGKLQENQLQVNISLVEHPDYQRLEDILAQALEPYDAARYAVANALRELER